MRASAAITPSASSASLPSPAEPLDSAPLHGRCYATLLFRDSGLLWMRRAWEDDEIMVRLWARLLLNRTALPVFVMHAGLGEIDFARLFDASTASRLSFRRVSLVHGGYWGAYQHYRLMHTKLHAWDLPCAQAAFLDYDTIPLRNMDAVFDACGSAELCGTVDRVYPGWTRRAARVINAGMMVLRPNRTTHRWLLEAAEADGRQHTRRMLAEQGFLSQVRRPCRRRRRPRPEAPRSHHRPEAPYARCCSKRRRARLLRSTFRIGPRSRSASTCRSGMA